MSVRTVLTVKRALFGRGSRTERVSSRERSGRISHQHRWDLEPCSDSDKGKVTSKDRPCLRTLSATSSKTLPPCITMTLLAISSALYAAASFWTASARSRCTRIALMATFLPPPMLPEASSPRLWAAGHAPLLPPRMEPRAAEDSPDDARTDSSAASSIRRRIVATLRNTPGSMGGGVGLPGIGKRGRAEAVVYDTGKEPKLRRGELGGV